MFGLILTAILSQTAFAELKTEGGAQIEAELYNTSLPLDSRPYHVQPFKLKVGHNKVNLQRAGQSDFCQVDFFYNDNTHILSAYHEHSGFKKYPLNGWIKVGQKKTILRARPLRFHRDWRIEHQQAWKAEWREERNFSKFTKGALHLNKANYNHSFAFDSQEVLAGERLVVEFDYELSHDNKQDVVLEAKYSIEDVNHWRIEQTNDYKVSPHRRHFRQVLVVPAHTNVLDIRILIPSNQADDCADAWIKNFRVTSEMDDHP